MRSLGPVLAWAALAAAMAAPIAAAAASPLLQWRGPVYIAAGLAGAIGLALLLAQPLLIGERMPGVSGRRAWRLHRWVGVCLVAAVAIHVTGLWIVSPPDVIDALLFRAPTAFSVWGVVAMWALVATALLAAFRRRLRLRRRVWRIGHAALAVAIVVGTAAHALLIEGAMETVTKVGLCALALLATAKVVADRTAGRRRVGRRSMRPPQSDIPAKKKGP